MTMIPIGPYIVADFGAIEAEGNTGLQASTGAAEAIKANPRGSTVLPIGPGTEGEFDSGYRELSSDGIVAGSVEVGSSPVHFVEVDGSGVQTWEAACLGLRLEEVTTVLGGGKSFGKGLTS